MTLHEKLQQLFDHLRLAPSDEVIVSPSGYGRFMITVVSSRFEAMPEEDRQDEVWRVILDNFSDYEQSKVEFVFTYSPSETAEQAEAANAGETDER